MPTPRTTATRRCVVLAVAMLVAYPLSLGPACWLHEQGCISQSTLSLAFYPVFRVYENSPSRLQDSMDWYTAMWSTRSDGIIYDPVL